LRWHDWLDRYSARVTSDGVGDAPRREAMNRVNPMFVMRNYLAQLAIDASTEGDHRPARCDAQPLYRTTGQGTIRRQTPRLGPHPSRLLDAQLQ